jgi:hypothetical protein
MTKPDFAGTWNAQADEHNQWSDLGESERLSWAYRMGLDEAVDLIAETCRVRLLNIKDANAYIANIETAKEGA